MAPKPRVSRNPKKVLVNLPRVELESSDEGSSSTRGKFTSTFLGLRDTRGLGAITNVKNLEMITHYKRTNAEFTDFRQEVTDFAHRNH